MVPAAIAPQLVRSNGTVVSNLGGTPGSEEATDHLTHCQMPLESDSRGSSRRSASHYCHVNRFILALLSLILASMPSSHESMKLQEENIQYGKEILTNK